MIFLSSQRVSLAPLTATPPLFKLKKQPPKTRDNIGEHIVHHHLSLKLGLRYNFDQILIMTMTKIIDHHDTMVIAINITLTVRLVVENVHGAMAAPVQLTVEHPLSMATVSIITMLPEHTPIAAALQTCHGMVAPPHGIGMTAPSWPGVPCTGWGGDWRG